MRRFSAPSLVLTSILLLFSSAIAGTTIHVPADQPTIQAGINAASNGDTVLVSPGTYYENINFMGKAITLTSASGPAVTIIDGSNAYAAAATFSSGESLRSVLSGFTLRNGMPEVSIQNSSPTVKGNVIAGGITYSSDGLYSSSGSPLIQGNLIAGNAGNGIVSWTDVGVQIIGNVIAGNGDSGINSQYAGGLDLIQQNSIIANGSDGIFFFPSSIGGNTEIIQNLISQNGGYGANLQAPLTLVSNTIAGNNIGCCGNAAEVFAELDTTATVQNNLIISVGSPSGLFCQADSITPTFTNNNVFSAGSSAYDGYCVDPTGTNGNLSVDPLFGDVLGGDFHLQSGSPVIGGGSISAPNEPKKDFDGDLRIVNNAIDIGADQYSLTRIQSVSSYSLHFPTQAVSTTSGPQTLTFSNNSTSAIKINLIATGPSFAQTNNCGTSLAPLASCQIQVTFSPLVGGTIRSAIGIFTSATSNPEAVALVGTGVAPQVQIGCCFYFYNQPIYATTTQSVSLSNTGQAPLLISAISYSGPTDFVESNNCPIAPNSLAVGSSCVLTVSFTPTIAGQESGTISVTSNAPPQTVYLNGSSVSAGNPVLSPPSLTFPTTLIGQTSAPQTMTLSNTGTGALGITQIYSYGDFPQTNDCPTSLAAGASCTFTVTYTPGVQGTESGYLYVYTDSATSVVSGSFTGTGTAPAPTISSLSVANAPAGGADTFVIVNGSGFINSSQILWNGVPLNYCCVSILGSGQIYFTLPAAALATAGANQISVTTPAPGGGTSNSVSFIVYPAVNYASKSVTYNYRNVTGTNLNMGAGYSAVITSPFPVQFGGGSFNTLTIGASGTVSFSSFGNGGNGPLPQPQTSTIIAPFWMYLYPFGSGTNNNVFWQVIGTAPNRQFVIEWRNLGVCCETTNTVRFEVVFFEGSSNILFNYADTVFGGSYSNYDNGAAATVGVQSSPTVFNQLGYDTASVTSPSALLWYPNNPGATLSTSTVNFGYHQIGTGTLPQALTLTNGGQVPLTISSIAIDNPDFTETNTCGTSVAPHQSCSIHVSFKPTQPTTETATLTITDNATTSPQTVSLSGTGTVTGILVFPVLVNFGSVTTNTTATAPVTLANATNQPLTVQGITTAPSVFTETNNCGSSVAPGQSCTVTVGFAPTKKGSIQGTLSMALNGKASTVKANLTGSGQ